MTKARHLRISIVDASIGHLIFAAFALLAILPVLMLIQMGVLSETYSIDLLHDRTQIALLMLFLVGCYAVGLVLLMAIVRQVRRAKTVSQRIKNESLPAIESVFQGTDLDLSELPLPEVDNELETLTDTLSRFQEEICKLIERVRPQATVFRQFQQIMEHLDEMIVMTDHDGRISFSNRAARATLGIMPERGIQQALAESKIEPQSQGAMAQLLGGERHTGDHISVTTSQGWGLHLSPFFRDFPSEDGDSLRLVLLRDLSDLKKLERQLYRSEKLASLGQLISGVAHELNNPLAAVLGFAELCRHSGMSRQELDGNLEIIEREARRTARIVENLLNFSRRRAVSVSPCDLHGLLERCFVLLHYQFKVNNIQVIRQYSGDIPRVKVDEFQVQQVFMNILANACQALSSIGVEYPKLRVATRLTEDGSGIVVEIADNGPGISADNADQIFEPFFTTKGEDQGTGLGLPISAKIMEDHGGAISLTEPTPGFSTAFLVTFPARCATAVIEKKDLVAAGTGKKCSGKVLIVEDEESILRISQAALEQIGLTVEAAKSIDAAKTALISREFTLVLVDFYMPDGHADQLIDFVRKSTPQLAERIIVSSGDPGISHKLQEAGYLNTPVVLKPFHLRDLQDAVRALLAEVPA